MTQKPQDMPQEIWAYQGKYQIGVSTRPVDPITGKANFPRSRYILAAPKKDVERALEWINAEIAECKKGEAHQLEHAPNFASIFTNRLRELETIRRVLMANAGRG